MRHTLTLPRHLWWSFRRPLVAREAKQTSLIATHDTKPRAPTKPMEERLWEKSRFVFFGIQMPNKFQMAFFTILCTVLSLPVFLLDPTDEALYHGLVTFASIAAFSAFMWLVGMLIANVSEGSDKKSSVK